MVNFRALREIVVSLRGLVWKAKDAGSPVASDLLSMAARAVGDVASAEQVRPGQAGRPEPVTRRLGEK